MVGRSERIAGKGRRGPVALAAITTGRVRRSWSGPGRHSEEALTGFVARGAGYACDGGVIHRGAGESREVRARVAVFARRPVGRNMSGRYSGGLDAVVARGTSRRDPTVTENSARPAQGRMAYVAFQVGIDVPRALALRLYVVMARRAASLRFRVIEVNCRAPSNRRVATLAMLRRKNVSRSFGGCPDRRSHSMAGGAVARSALEDRIRMTGFAGQVAVLPDELEPGRQVIERVACLRTENCCWSKCERNGEQDAGSVPHAAGARFGD